MKAAMPAPTRSPGRRPGSLPGALGRRGIGQHPDERRFVRDEGADVIGVGGDERERGHRAPAAAEHSTGPAPSAWMTAWRSPAWTAGKWSLRPSLRMLRPSPRGS